MAFRGDGSSGGIRRVGGPMDGLLGVERGAKSMTGNMCGCHRLTARPGSRTSRGIRAYFTSSSVRIKRSLTTDRHAEYSRIYPCLERFESVSRSMVFWISLLKVWHDTQCTIYCPDG